MLFRVTFTNNVDEHYKEVPTDSTISVPIGADNFKEAVLAAERLMEVVLLWPGTFEVLSVEHIEVEAKEYVPNFPDFGDEEEFDYSQGAGDSSSEEGDSSSGETSDIPHEEYRLRLPTDWSEITGIQIMDPDGWHGPNALSWITGISRSEFIERANMSTCRRYPNPLWDEVS